MNYKIIIEFGFRIIWRIIEISEGVIDPPRPTTSADNTLLLLLLHKILSFILIVIKITYIFQAKKGKEKILILAPLNPFRFFGTNLPLVYISPKNELHLLKPLHLSLGSCQEDTFFEVFVCYLFYISFILMLKEDHLPRHSQTRPTYYSGTSMKRLVAKDRRNMFARRCNRRSFVISRFFSVYFSVASRWYILYCFYIKIVFIIIIYIKNSKHFQRANATVVYLCCKSIHPK